MHDECRCEDCENLRGGMTVERYEKEVKRTAGTSSVLMAALGLAGECGEVVDEVKKVEFHSKPYDRHKLISELGDLLWYYTLIRIIYGVSQEEIMEVNVAKLRQRYPDGFTEHTATNR